MKERRETPGLPYRRCRAWFQTELPGFRVDLPGQAWQVPRGPGIGVADPAGPPGWAGASKVGLRGLNQRFLGGLARSIHTEPRQSRFKRPGRPPEEHLGIAQQKSGPRHPQSLEAPFHHEIIPSLVTGDTPKTRISICWGTCVPHRRATYLGRALLASSISTRPISNMEGPPSAGWAKTGIRFRCGERPGDNRPPISWRVDLAALARRLQRPRKVSAPPTVDEDGLGRLSTPRPWAKPGGSFK